jgi:hypothetical protein
MYVDKLFYHALWTDLLALAVHRIETSPQSHRIKEENRNLFTPAMWGRLTKRNIKVR